MQFEINQDLLRIGVVYLKHFEGQIKRCIKERNITVISMMILFSLEFLYYVCT